MGPLIRMEHQTTKLRRDLRQRIDRNVEFAMAETAKMVVALA
jgi:hypothetical protein